MSTDLVPVAARLEAAGAEETIRWALAEHERVAVASSFQADSTVVIDMAVAIRPDVPVLFLETGFHFEETIAFKDQLTEMLGLNVVDLRGDLSVDEQAERHGERLYERDPVACCRLNKVEPLQRALGGYDAWLTGLRRGSSATRAEVAVVEPDTLGSGRTVVKVNPLAAWTRAQVWAYLDEHDLPRHPLYDLGYASIGCAPCTRALFPGEDERAGRWAGVDKVECGIHLGNG